MTRMIVISLLLLVLLSACGAQHPLATPFNTPEATSTPTIQASVTPSERRDIQATPCGLKPVVAPTLPAVIPGYTDLDPVTGLHMTGKYQQIDLSTYRLKIMGKVEHLLSLSYDDLRCMPKIESRPTLVCPGFFTDVAAWAGVPLKSILEQAVVLPDATDVRLNSADGYSATITLREALSEENYLAYEWEGEPLPILHGFPVRAVFPHLQGNTWVKWLISIELY